MLSRCATPTSQPNIFSHGTWLLQPVFTIVVLHFQRNGLISQIFADQIACLLHKIASSSRESFDELLLSYRFETGAHAVFPSILRWSLRYEEPVCPRCQRWHQGQISKTNKQTNGKQFQKHDMLDNLLLWLHDSVKLTHSDDPWLLEQKCAGGCEEMTFIF